MNLQTKVVLSLIIGGILLTFGDVFIKIWAVTDHKVNYLLGIVFWICGFFFLAWTYKHKNMATATLFYIVINIITLTLVSWFYFKEPLTLKQMIGILIGLFAISLV